MQDGVHELAKKLGYRSRDIWETWLIISLTVVQDVVHELAKKLGYRSRDIGETWLSDREVAQANGAPDILRNGVASAF